MPNITDLPCCDFETYRGRRVAAIKRMKASVQPHLFSWNSGDRQAAADMIFRLDRKIQALPGELGV